MEEKEEKKGIKIERRGRFRKRRRERRYKRRIAYCINRRGAGIEKGIKVGRGEGRDGIREELHK